MTPIDIGASLSASSGVQSDISGRIGGVLTSGDFIVGGSGGVSKSAPWLVLGLIGAAMLALLIIVRKLK